MELKDIVVGGIYVALRSNYSNLNSAFDKSVWLITSLLGSHPIYIEGKVLRVKDVHSYAGGFLGKEINCPIQALEKKREPKRLKYKDLINQI